MLQLIQKTYKKFEEALSERGDLNQYTKYDLDEYNHSLAKLEAYLTGTDSNMTESDARIYHYYASEQHAHFVKLAEEIDGAYKGEK